MPPNQSRFPLRTKPLLLAALLLLPAAASYAQYITLPQGDYLDTTTSRNPACAKAPVAHYYSVAGKYPRSSETLAAQAQAFISRNGRRYRGEGNVMFRFVIDCQGRREPRTQLLQTDAQYRRTALAPELVRELYAFVQTLTDWKVATAPFPVRYFTYLNFKIHAGNVVAVTP